MSINSLDIYNSFNIFAEDVLKTVERLPLLYKTIKIKAPRIEELYELYFLKLWAEFESSFEIAIIGLITGEIIGHNGTVIPIATTSTPQEMRSIVLQNKKHIQLIPLNNSLDLAKLYLSNAEPIGSLDERQKQEIDMAHKLRNRIAHKSDKSNEEFLEVVKKLGVPAASKSSRVEETLSSSSSH